MSSSPNKNKLSGRSLGGIASLGNDSNLGWSVVSTLVSGVAVWGGVGWAIAHWSGQRAFIPGGIMLGSVAALYLVVVRFTSAPLPGNSVETSAEQPGQSGISNDHNKSNTERA